MSYYTATTRQRLEYVLDEIADRAVAAAVKSMKEDGVLILPGRELDRATEKLAEVIHGELFARLG